MCIHVFHNRIPYISIWEITCEHLRMLFNKKKYIHKSSNYISRLISSDNNNGEKLGNIFTHFLAVICRGSCGGALCGGCCVNLRHNCKPARMGASPGRWRRSGECEYEWGGQQEAGRPGDSCADWLWQQWQLRRQRQRRHLNNLQLNAPRGSPIKRGARDRQGELKELVLRKNI